MHTKYYLDRVVPDAGINRLVVQEKRSIILAFESAPASVQTGCALVEQHLMKMDVGYKKS